MHVLQQHCLRFFQCMPFQCPGQCGSKRFRSCCAHIQTCNCKCKPACLLPVESCCKQLRRGSGCAVRTSKWCSTRAPARPCSLSLLRVCGCGCGCQHHVAHSIKWQSDPESKDAGRQAGRQKEAVDSGSECVCRHSTHHLCAPVAATVVFVQGLIYTAGTIYNVLHYFHIPIHVQEVRPLGLVEVCCCYHQIALDLYQFCGRGMIFVAR